MRLERCERRAKRVAGVFLALRRFAPRANPCQTNNSSSWFLTLTNSTASLSAVLFQNFTIPSLLAVITIPAFSETSVRTTTERCMYDLE